MQKEPHRSGFPKSMQLLCRAFRINPKAQLLFTPLCQDRQQQRESAGCNQNGDMQCAFSCLWRSRNVLPLRQRNSFLDRCLCRNIVGSRCRRLRAVVCCMISVCGNGLQNINRRIWLGYGGDSGLTIDSTEGEGFTVKLKLRLGGM